MNKDMGINLGSGFSVMFEHDKSLNIKEYPILFEKWIPYLKSNGNIPGEYKKISICSCYLFKNGEMVSLGESCCNLLYDEYNVNIGRKLSFTRALSYFKIEKNMRMVLWKSFLNYFPEIKYKNKPIRDLKPLCSSPTVTGADAVRLERLISEANKGIGRISKEDRKKALDIYYKVLSNSKK